MVGDQVGTPNAYFLAAAPKRLGQARAAYGGSPRP